MSSHGYSWVALGMLFGIFIGGGLGASLFASTGNVMYILLPGVGAGLGIVIGAGIQRANGKKSQQ